MQFHMEPVGNQMKNHGGKIVRVVCCINQLLYEKKKKWPQIFHSFEKCITNIRVSSHVKSLLSTKRYRKDLVIFKDNLKKKR